MAELLTYGSLALAAVNITVTLLVGHGRRAGWILAACMQVPWTGYDIATRQWGFLALTVITVPTYLREYRRARQGKETRARHPARR